MKRHDNLQPLSRQHHDELLACLLLKKGIKKKADLPTMQAFTRQFWNEDLAAHVRAEETTLIPLLMANPSLKHFANVLHNDHELIETIFERSQNGGLSYRMLEMFADTLEEHIRFEERIVFSSMQELLPEGAWEKLAFAERKGKSCESYPVKFWE
ncbi:MAG: hemerythrin domain-containing protein [Bacteroidetes bacterium]|nr:hemerythrin domain-containing protein [Bacteroidota bacterium]